MSMRYQTLPNTSLTPSLLCLGTGGYGTNIPADAAWRLLDAFAEMGGNFVDTARVYGAWVPGGEGASERVLGSWLRRRKMHGHFVIATKGGHPKLSSMDRSRLSPAEISADLAASLADLQADQIDLYLLHRDDPAVPVGEILSALNEHLAAGRVRALGASNWSIERLAEAEAYAGVHGLAGFSVSQIGWSFARVNESSAALPGMRFMDQESLAYHRRTNLAVMAYSSQAQGFFTGKFEQYREGQVQDSDPSSVRLYAHAENFARLDRARLLASRLERTPNEIALAYLLQQPFPTFPIVGCRSVEQVRASCAAVSLSLTADEMAYLVDGIG
jgi:aryl-alcohol dehydrogenase-like predicted oxidoreductase